MPSPTDQCIRPFPGMQEMALASRARVLVTGGRAGPGKTYGMLMAPLYFLHYQIETSVIMFRPMAQDLWDDGGILADAREIYLPQGAVARQPPIADFRWRFRNKGLSIKFAALSEVGDERKHMGPQRGMVAFDQLELFFLQHFTYLFTRARAKKDAGFIPFIRATVNPVVRGDPKSGWIRELIDWWIGADGFADKSRRGLIRYFVRAPDDYNTPFVVDTKENLLRTFPKKRPISLSFIHGEREDNPLYDWESYDEMIGVEEEYIQQQLIHGNWNVGPKDATKIWNVPESALFEDNDQDFQTVLRAPGPLEWIGMWDYARSAKALVWLVGILAPGAPPVLWMVAALVWEDADAIQAAKDRASLLEHLAGVFGVSIGSDDVRDAGDPSGEYRSGPTDTWGDILRRCGVPLLQTGHILLGRDRKPTFLNSDFGFTVRVKLVQQWLTTGRLRLRDRAPEAAPIIQALRGWKYDVPAGMKKVDVNRQFLRPTKGLESHVGDAQTYGAALAHSIIQGRQGRQGSVNARVVDPPRPGGIMGGPGLPAP